ncbi:hypothetical protein ACIQU6_04970 [Streptomyces sp. NPDC090442]|uniref:hypothetical protein n=1 Tax=Streptomyces sp. NPDC090442 TaxID=3365962 RepID=UPI0038035A0F
MWLLRVLTAAGLAVDAYVHIDLADAYDAIGTGISQGTLFRIQGAAAALAAVLVLVRGRNRWVWAFAFLVAAAALGAVLLYRYVDVGSLGPLPNMYEPVWYPEKTASAVAEAVAALGAAVGFVTVSRHRTPSGRT